MAATTFKPGDTDNNLLRKILDAILTGGGGGGGGTGTVTSVGLSMPVEFLVAGSPVTTSGSFSVTFANQAANLVLASPAVGAGSPAFRALVSADLPASVVQSPALLLEATSASAARLTALPAAVAAITVDDLLYFAVDVAGTPDSVKGTVQQLWNSLIDLDGIVGPLGSMTFPIYSIGDAETQAITLSQLSSFTMDTLNTLTGAAVLAMADKFHVYQAGSKAGTIQQIHDSVNVMIAAGALATSDKVAAYQAGGKSATVQQIFDTTNVLTGAGALATSDKLAGYQAGGKSVTVQQVHDSVNVLTAAGALATSDKVAAYQAGGKSATVQQLFDATNVLTAAGALATSDKVAAFQATGKSATIQQIFDATNVLTAASSPLSPTVKLAAFQTTGKSATVQQVLDAIDGLAAAGTVVSTDTIALIQSAAAKEATITQLQTYMQANLSFGLSGSAFSTVGGSTSATTNGTALLAAYTAAAAATPHGAALSDSNRFTILLLPGRFDLGASALTMNAEFVDIVGLGRPINGTVDDLTLSVGGCVVVSSANAINKTANNAHLMNFAVKTTSGTPTIAAITSSGAHAAEIFCDMIFDGNDGGNSSGMGRLLAWGGYYKDCYNIGDSGFGSGSGGNATGTFFRCKSGPGSFGGSGGNATGNFLYCEAGEASFGAGGSGNASGVFIGCRRNTDYGSSGSNMFGEITASGTFIYCDCIGTGGFGNGTSGTANGTFLWCSAGAGFGAASATSTGAFRWCISTGGGFSAAGTAAGTYEYCSGGANSFGGGSGTASGTFINCRALNSAFGGGASSGGTTSGLFVGCVGGTHCFGSASTTGGTLSGRVLNCFMDGHMIVNLTGKIENMRIEAVAANTSAIALISTSTGALYNCTLIGTGSGTSINVVSGTPTIKFAHCRLNKGVTGAINAIGTPYNVDDTDII